MPFIVIIIDKAFKFQVIRRQGAGHHSAVCFMVQHHSAAHQHVHQPHNNSGGICQYQQLLGAQRAARTGGGGKTLGWAFIFHCTTPLSATATGVKAIGLLRPSNR